MKQFFKFFGAALLAHVVFWVFSSIMVVITLFSLVAVVVSGEYGGKVHVEKNSIIELNVSAHFPEKRQGGDLGGKFTMKGFQFLTGLDEDEELTLLEVCNTIAKAADDPNIVAIKLQASGLGSYGITVAERLREALLAFQSKGKKIYAYADNMSEMEYVVASVADHVVMHPQGNLIWDGMSSRLTFYSKLLKEWGVKAQVFYAGNYKSATEQYRLDKMSSYNKEQLRALLEQANDRMINDVAHSRHLSVESLKRMADNLEVASARKAYHANMIDGLGVYEEFKRTMEMKLPSKPMKEEDIHYVSLEDYNQSYPADELLNQSYDASSDHQIAMLYMDGTIDDKEINEGDYVEYIKALEKNEDVKAVVVRINSPGGSSMISESIWWQLKQLKRKKPVMMSLANVAASGGYYIACAGDSIFAAPSVITGSIGVFALVPSAEGLMKNKFSLTFDEVSTSPHASASNHLLTRDLDELEGKSVQEMVDSIYSMFLQRVSEGRRMSRDAVHAIAQGRVWTGKDALERGLIDGFGNEDRALKAAAAKAKLSSFQVRIYPEHEENWIEKKLKKKFGNALQQWGVLRVLFHPEVKQVAEGVQAFEQMMGKPQMRLPYQLSGDLSIP